jgi:hypothetical protein
MSFEATHSPDETESSDGLLSVNMGRMRTATSATVHLKASTPATFTFHRNFSDLNVHSLSYDQHNYEDMTSDALSADEKETNSFNFPRTEVLSSLKEEKTSAHSLSSMKLKHHLMSSNLSASQSDLSLQGWNPTDLNHLQKLWRWIICMCNVTFDIDIGQGDILFL